MSKVLKYIMIGLMGVMLANCSTGTYKIKKENKSQVLKVPSWYMNDYSEKKIIVKTKKRINFEK